MIANSTGVCPLAPTTADSSRLYKIGEVAERFNLHPNTIRRGADKGELPAYVLPSGHRRFALNDVYRWLGIEQGELNGGDARVPVALVARVSSRGQASARGKSDASDLDRQVSRLKAYARERWGNTANTTLYVSVGSGLNFERVEFLKLIDDILAGKFKGGFVVATYFDRVCRYGIQMVRQICKAGGCELVFTETDAEKECHETLADEILGILTHFTAKASGEKAKRALKVVVPEDVLHDIWRWHKAGYSYYWIGRKLREQNRHKDEKGRTISKHVVRVAVLDNRDALEALSPSTPILHSFGRFHQECIRRASDKLRLKKKKLMAKYAEWCEREDETPMSGRAVGKFLKTLGIQKRFDRTGCVAYVGLSLLG